MPEWYQQGFLTSAVAGANLRAALMASGLWGLSPDGHCSHFTLYGLFYGVVTVIIGLWDCCCVDGREPLWSFLCRAVNKEYVIN